MYYTNDCPFEGWYGRGLNCRPCPEGARCPGGYRIWPLPGWYVPLSPSLLVSVWVLLSTRSLTFFALCILSLISIVSRRWNEGEFTGAVFECDSALRCLGGRFSRCGEGYTAALCASCATNYYALSDVCLLCESDGFIIILYVIQVQKESLGRLFGAKLFLFV